MLLSKGCGGALAPKVASFSLRSTIQAEGAVDAAVGAKRVLHEVLQGGMSTSGKFINCEDGLQIPW